MEINKQLEQEVRDIICTLYNHEFTNRLEVLSGDGEYVLKLYLYDLLIGPLAIATLQKSDKEFLDFIVEQLRTRNLVRAQHYKVQLYGNN